jgi:asparagine synthase (glutamine-hydrolysing)
MSVIFGSRRPFGEAVSQEELRQLASMTGRHAPDGTLVQVYGRIGMGFQPFHTTERSRLESQPVIGPHGNVLVFDGRLDNHDELRHQLGIAAPKPSDSFLVLAAFERWNEQCFSLLVGDWALALWSARQQIVYLARDHAGTRTLYFQNDRGTLTWATHLETFFSGTTAQTPDEEYAARYLALQPIGDLTPFKGIRSVPPAHYLIVKEDSVAKVPHWNWFAKGSIRYTSDRQYDEHFLELFKQSVRRRTIPGAPILAHLSGGMDSTSIVCMSDHMRQSQDSAAELLDTLSYYDDDEPNWDEKQYFSITEARRGKVGIHMEALFEDSAFEIPDSPQFLHLFPGADNSGIKQERRLQGAVGNRDYRVMLSGIGGDELLGGVPTPMPELANLLVSGKVGALLRRALQWCVVERSPLIRMLYRTSSFAARQYLPGRFDTTNLPGWMTPGATKLMRASEEPAFRGQQRFNIRPSAISNGRTWWHIMETLPSRYPESIMRYEYRYPYLDRELVDFLYRIPREQLVQPGRRRLLMRRALKDIVPEEILERRRKGYLARSPIASLQGATQRIESILADPLLAGYGLADRNKLNLSATKVLSGTDTREWPYLMRAIGLELWLREWSKTPLLGKSPNESDKFMLGLQPSRQDPPALGITLT